MFTPSRLTLARERRQFTKRSLAEAIGVSAHTVLRYESGEIVPADEALERLTRVLGFPADFFQVLTSMRFPRTPRAFGA